MLVLTREEFDSAALVLVCREDGSYDWSSTHDARAVANQLELISKQIRTKQGHGGLTLP